MRLFHSNAGAVVERGGRHHALPDTWDALVNRPDLREYLNRQLGSTAPAEKPIALRPPIGSQEVWAAGVTYFRSRDARMEEAQAAGGGGGSPPPNFTLEPGDVVSITIDGIGTLTNPVERRV